MLKKISLEEHQKILYEILYAVDDFCKQYNIHYFLAFGSLLGAVRHKSIIPWDDDIDIMMERTEYERFQKMIYKHPIPGYTAYCIHKTSDYYYPFIKFGKDKTLLKEPFAYVPRNGIGINIDIFPMDGCPSDDIEQNRLYARAIRDMIWNSLHYWTCHSNNHFVGYKSKFIYNLFKLKFVKKRILINCYNKSKQYKVKESEYICDCTWSFTPEKTVFLKKLFISTIFMKFGKRDLPVPAGYHEILKSIYGDYMTPPPTDKRGTTHQHGGVFIIEEHHI